LLDKKVGFSTYIHGIFGVYRLLYYKTIEFHAKIWERGFGQFFLNIDSLSFEESIIVYSNIDSINHKSLISAGVFLYYLIYNNKIEHKNYILSINNFLESLDKALDEKKFSNFEKRLTLKKQEVKYTIEDIDIMDGKEFEEFIALLFSKLGYLTEVTKSSGDQGIDIIAEKNGKKIGIQAKCYSHSVTNTAVQEVVAGKNHYNLDKVIVVTNNYFTKSAIELAESNNVVLWDRNILKEKITEVIN
jgi:HJR/Mrr/RecB family endonuclease